MKRSIALHSTWYMPVAAALVEHFFLLCTEIAVLERDSPVGNLNTTNSIKNNSLIYTPGITDYSLIG